MSAGRFPHFLAQAVAVVVLLLLGLLAGRTYRVWVPQRPAVFLALGDTLPVVDLREVHGDQLMLEGLLVGRGQTVIILFSPQCASCAGEARAWEGLAEKHRDTAFILIAITADLDSVRPFWNGQITLPFYTADHEAFDRFRAPGSPTIHVADEQRRVVFASGGIYATRELSTFLSQRIPTSVSERHSRD